MKKFILLSAMFIVFTMASFGNTPTSPDVNIVNSEQNRDTKIQVAILLDTSSSMDGLIEQAKSRLWNIVNTLTTLKYNGRTPKIEIALYEYGNDNLRRADGYIRQVTPLTTDLDLISAKLFSLTTYGGDEYCGTVISKAVEMLNWGSNSSDMKLIYIAGNEPFNQGSVSYKTAISRALAKGIYVNTIHCGRTAEGIEGMWRDGAERGKGKFFNIDHNARVRYYDTPYDDRISACNDRLNRTYISYGAKGFAHAENQRQQDVNAMSMSKSNFAERAVSKSKQVYNNSAWDLVDKVKEDSNALNEIEQSELPQELQNKSKAEIQKLVTEKETERAAIQKEIAELAKKRQEYIDEQAKKDNTSGDDLGKAINESILAFANVKGYTINK
ncbi:VWA domain-containing protein [Dysgonomonas sp. 521]|uniref:VWA domain-containing protein n=1 Tax=Dysgonomonas sp. 521 TaxID=2302932 RepID=UPI0013D484D6|nr:VWA domain-containing protein [Dysgonomonas sp. 521]NDV94368.1 VWA domain-containing protein [Dysgonomonas sp. 521]